MSSICGNVPSPQIKVSGISVRLFSYWGTYYPSAATKRDTTSDGEVCIFSEPTFQT